MSESEQWAAEVVRLTAERDEARTLLAGWPDERVKKAEAERDEARAERDRLEEQLGRLQVARHNAVEDCKEQRAERDEAVAKGLDLAEGLNARWCAAETERDEAIAHLRAVLGEAEALERLLGTDGSSHSFTLEDARSFLASLDDEDGGS